MMPSYLTFYEYHLKILLYVAHIFRSLLLRCVGSAKIDELCYTFSGLKSCVFQMFACTA